MREFILCTAAILGLPFSVQAGVLFFDDFNGSSIDLTKWGNIHNQGTMEVSGGTLRTYGGGDHHHMTSNVLFNLSVGLEVSARMRISDVSFNGGLDYDFHSLALSHSDQSSPASWESFHFSSYDDRDGENFNTVHWYATSVPPGSEYARGIAPASWNDFHVFAIRRVAGGVSFLIDGLEVGFAPTSFAGPLPVYIGGDRRGLFEVDWVRVEDVPEPSTWASMLVAVCLIIVRRYVTTSGHAGSTTKQTDSSAQ